MSTIEAKAGDVFTVRGRGAFPLDMLRYDSCWPARGIDVEKITPRYETAEERDEMSWREVTLMTYGDRKNFSPVTAARWASFNWKVVEEGVA